MNKIIVLVLIALAPAYISRGFSQTATQGILTFDDTKKGFGMVKEGSLVHLEYSFKNTGTAPVLIIEYKVACTCTKVEFPKEPILPGQTGVIKVDFDTKNKYDRQDRTIQLISNGKGSPQELRFKGVVLKNKSKE